jgi:signal transduction histidine kinase
MVNSVNALRITLDVLQRDFELFEDSKRMEYVNRGLNLVDRQHKLLESLRSYTRADVEDTEEIDFVPFWEDLMRSVQENLAFEKITLRQDLDTGPCLVAGNRTALTRAVHHIIENAVEALEDIDRKEIYIRASRANHGLKILIKDNGCGIKARHRERAFIPLFTTRKGKAGIGLSVARKLLLKMGGGIEMMSIWGEGTEMRLWMRTVDHSKRRSSSE